MILAASVLLLCSLVLVTSARTVDISKKPAETANVIFKTGGSSNKSENETRMFDITKKVWCSSKDLPVPLSLHETVTLKNRAIIMGGDNSKAGKANMGTVEVRSYDPQTDEYTDLAKFQSNHEAFVAVAYGDKIYAIGGVYDPIDVEKTEIYDGKQWSEGPRLTTGRFNAAAAATDNGEIWVLSGQTNSNTAITQTEYLNVKEAGAAWQPGPPLNLGRLFHAAAAVGNDVYVCGGVAANPSDGPFIADCEKLVRSSGNLPAAAKNDGKWVKVASMLQGRAEFGLLAFKGKLYAVGGISDSAGHPIRNIEEYDPVTDKWSLFAEWTAEHDYEQAQYNILTDVPVSSMKCS